MYRTISQPKKKSETRIDFSTFLAYTVTMSLLSSYKQWLSTHVPAEFRLWFNSLLLGLYIYLIIALYKGGVMGVLHARVANISLGYAAYMLILLAMAMSSICYFWNFADKYMIYRKYLGIMGSIYGVFHFVLSLMLILEKNTLSDFISNPRNTVPFITGFIALIIVLFLTTISYGWAAKLLGGRLWRSLLRLGYAAVILSIIHMSWRNIESWAEYLQGDTLMLFPPLSMIIFVVTLVILLLRLIMQYDLHQKKSPKVSPGIFQK